MTDDTLYFDAPTPITHELAEDIGCGLPEVLAAHRDWHHEPMVCTSVDAETRVITFDADVQPSTTCEQYETAMRRRWGKTFLVHALHAHTDWPKPRWLIPGL